MSTTRSIQGRPTKLTRDLIRNLESALQQTSTMKKICQQFEIGEATFYRWMAYGEKAPQGLLRELHEAVRRARAPASLAQLDRVAEANGWTSKTWFKELRNSHEYDFAKIDPARG